MAGDTMEQRKMKNAVPRHVQRDFRVQQDCYSTSASPPKKQPCDCTEKGDSRQRGH
jgi:hypothetical protein